MFQEINQYKMCIGIDPGTNGGIAVCHNDTVTTHKIPQNPADLLRTLQGIKTKGLDTTVALELISPRPYQSLKGVVTSSYKFGLLMMGLISVFSEESLCLITPQTWQKELGLNRRWKKPDWVKNEKDQERWRAQKYRERKKLHLDTAREMFSCVRVVHQNADALLILEYCRRVHGND